MASFERAHLFVLQFYSVFSSIKENKLLRASEFAKWNALALWHSVVCYFSSYAIFSTGTPFYSDGKLEGSFEFGALVIMLTITVVHVKVSSLL